jgi:hypothetical protein
MKRRHSSRWFAWLKFMIMVVLELHHWMSADRATAISLFAICRSPQVDLFSVVGASETKRFASSLFYFTVSKRYERTVTPK